MLVSKYRVPGLVSLSEKVKVGGVLVLKLVYLWAVRLDLAWQSVGVKMAAQQVQLGHIQLLHYFVYSTS